jgi:hypothetical protein
MIVYDLNFVSVALAPPKANPPLVVDADAVLAFTWALQGFERIAWWYSQLPQFCRRLQDQQLPSGIALNVRRKSAGQLCPKKSLRFRARETQNHFCL